MRSFVESAASGQDEQERSWRQSVLLEYLKSASPPPDDNESISLPNLLLAWSFAAETSHDKLLAATLSLLTTLLKTLSHLIEFRKVGTQLCHSILKRDSLRPVDKIFDLHNTKEYLISPCLKLLTEIVTFDGGVCARSLHNHRHTTWKRLPALLFKRSSDGKFHKRHSPASIRSSAVRYALANMRHQSVPAKEDLISIPKLVISIFKDIADDPPPIVAEILTTTSEILSNNAISIKTKDLLFTEETTTSIASLYRYRLGRLEDHSKARELCHSLLMRFCTSLTRDSSSLSGGHSYKPEATEDDASLALQDSLSWNTVIGEDTKPAHIRHPVLLALLHSLKPYSDLKQRDLVLEIFKVVPELVAHYFISRKNLSLEPQLSAEWLGNASFVLSVLQLPTSPLATTGGTSVPQAPHISILMQTILPQPVTRATLSKCLDHEQPFVKFLASNLMIAALQKLSKTAMTLCSQSKGADSSEMMDQIISAAADRLPSMQHLVAAFRRCSEENKMLKQSLVNLISLYHLIVPRLALEAGSDFSVTIAKFVEKEPVDSPGLEFQALEFESYMRIAYCSSEMRWWNKPGT